MTPPDRSLELLHRVEYRLARTDAEKEAVFRLRYRAYLHEGAILPRADQRLTDRFDEAANSWIFGIFIDGMLCSSLRISVATPEMPDTPAVEAFPDLLRQELALGRTIVDPNRFVADPAREVKFPQLPYVTLRLAYVACTHFKADIGTATVRREHQAFYKRVFLHKPLCEPRPYPTLIKPLSLMAVHYPSMREKVFARYPMFRSTPLERAHMFDHKSTTLVPTDLPPFPMARKVAAH